MSARNTWRTLATKIAFAIAIFIAANVMVYETSGYFQREQEYHAVVDGFKNHRHVKSIFVGDSHVAQLDNEILADGAYNVAVGGDGLREVYAKLRYLLSQPNEIDTLFLTADAHMFGTGRLQSSNGAFADIYLLRTGSPYGIGHGRLAAAFNLVPLFNDDFVQYLKMDIVKGWKRAPRGDDDEDTDAGWSSRPQEERGRIARETGIGDHQGIGAHPEPFQWYARIVSLARAHGVRVIAVRYPSTAEYFESVTPEEDAVIDRGLSAAGVTDILDYRRVFADASYFKDPDHLSAKGVAALMQLLESQTHRKLRADGSDERPPGAPSATASR
jgi:hypothetical protein